MAEEFKPQYTFTDDRLNELKQLFPEAWRMEFSMLIPQRLL